MSQRKKLRINALCVDSDFKQSGGSCVLASYALAASYFTGIPIPSFFAGYVEHFGIVPAHGQTSEGLYASHFDSEWRRRKVRGYEVILDVHRRSHVSCFVAARQMMKGTFFFHSDTSFLEKKLRKRRAFLNVSYNAGHEFHSISVFSDGKLRGDCLFFFLFCIGFDTSHCLTLFDSRYLFGRDTNRKNCFLLNKGLGSIGVLRDSVLYESFN